jgi:hypothetical protein
MYENGSWMVADKCDKNLFGRVLKISTSLGDHDGSNIQHAMPMAQVQGDKIHDASSYNAFKDMLRECMDATGVDDHNQLVNALI